MGCAGKVEAAPSLPDGGGNDGSVTTCTPSEVPINLDIPIGTTDVYARYRVNNGEWLNFHAPAEGQNLDFYLSKIVHPFPVTQQLVGMRDNQIRAADNSFLFSEGGNGYKFGDDNGPDGDIKFPFPFFVAFKGDTLYGSPAQDMASEDIYDSEGNFIGTKVSAQVLDTTPVTVEFVTSAGTGLDLVKHAFGGDITLHACGYANWGGI
ncbi:hypothetical protein R0I52_00200 [Psychrobacter sp. CAM01]|uniref:hypothetical protein n=1 Tax=Psychrobacter sp. CAM01 TaxID=3080335 RepID=UPI002935FA87|nr:hypothetical protein [Psychrobacter sp. CAM01]MDV2859132.1 hypothetical protein [Psychrobacter sp. CAM01]